MNGLYAAAGRWLFDAWMRGGVLNMPQVSFTGHYSYNRYSSANVGSIPIVGMRGNLYSSNGNALARAYYTISREKSAGEGQYQQGQDWIVDMGSVENFMQMFTKYLEER